MLGRGRVSEKRGAPNFAPGSDNLYLTRNYSINDCLSKLKKIKYTKNMHFYAFKWQISFTLVLWNQFLALLTAS